MIYRTYLLYVFRYIYVNVIIKILLFNGHRYQKVIIICVLLLFKLVFNGIANNNRCSAELCNIL